ncbi:cupin [Salipaludibacillus neizhouensis]|uniref:Cupin n=1 Tax=Salipaludibacillus neizhouensis TaxID=885475 RepID=A0A3A9KCJ7_9BACI|nr:cupin domain-containing protein [Salipaludibacillus neizhouensis]RKL67343.1 cupin [Salipaludibacillus neizhouensis]
MNYGHNSYPYPYYVNPPNYNSDDMLRNSQGLNEKVTEAILAGVKREANAFDFYTRLVNTAPNQMHRNEILQALDLKKVHVAQLTNLYTNVTGRQPEYQVENIPFHSYEDGLRKAYEAELEGFDDYQKSSLLTQNPHVQNVFLGVLHGEEANATRMMSLNDEAADRLNDYGTEPLVIDIEEVTTQNNTFRTALWTGDHLQVTLMSIDVGDDIGLELHPNLDQFIRIQEGQGIVQMGDSQDQLDFQERAYADYAIMVPAGKWHNLTNTGNQPIKLYSIYAPPEHPHGTVHETKADAMAAEESQDH